MRGRVDKSILEEARADSTATLVDPRAVIDPLYDNRPRFRVQGSEEAIVANPQLVFIRTDQTDEEVDRIVCGLLQLSHNAARNRWIELAQISRGLVGPNDRPLHPSQPQTPLDLLVADDSSLSDIEAGIE